MLPSIALFSKIKVKILFELTYNSTIRKKGKNNMCNRLSFRVILKFSSWFLNLFNIRLLIKRTYELLSKFKKLPIFLASVKKLNV